MDKVSLIMVCHGKAPRIIGALKSAISLIDEIVLFDIGLDLDVVAQIKRTHFDVPVRFVKVHEPVPYVELIREKTKVEAKYDYILFLDEDEELSPELSDVLRTNVGKYDYFSFPRKNIIFNKWIENSQWWPDYQVRLFRKSKVTWPQTIHSQPILSGNGMSVGSEEKLSLIHYNYNSIDEYLGKMTRYARAQAKERFDKNQKFTITDSFEEGISEFVSRFFMEKGYKDGLHGLILATLQMFNCFMIYCYFFEMKKFVDVSPLPVEKVAKNFFESGTYEVNHWLNSEGLQSHAQKIKSKIINKIIK